MNPPVRNNTTKNHNIIQKKIHNHSINKKMLTTCFVCSNAIYKYTSIKLLGG